MAVYKVPQDVEADDKLIGPFSFRQFIYLIIVVISMFVGYMLGKIFIGLAIIVLPIIVLFGALALPLRKDQPMETYLVAVVHFLLKPRIRMWSPEGAMTMVTITTPKVAEQHLTKDYDGDVAAQRLSYLAQVVDTQGWATRGVTHANDTMSDIVLAEAQATEDIMDPGASISRSFDQLITENDSQRKQQVMAQFQQGITSPPSPQTAALPVSNPPASSPSAPPSVNLSATAAEPTFNPYPHSMHQRVINPTGSQPTPEVSAPAPQKPVTPIAAAPSPDIMRLANTKDLSISALAHEAHRLETKGEEEVVISLR